MRPFAHPWEHRLLTASQSLSTQIQSKPQHLNQLPGGPAKHATQSFPTGRCPLLPLGGLNEPAQHRLPTAFFFFFFFLSGKAIHYICETHM